MNNPSLRSESRTQTSRVLKINHDVSLLAWIEETGRFMEQEILVDPKLLEDEEDITAALLGSDYEDDDDDAGGDFDD